MTQAQRNLREHVKALLRERRAALDPKKHGIAVPTGQGRRAEGSGVSQRAVDEFLGLTEGTTKALESGRRQPDYALERIADLYGLNRHEREYLRLANHVPRDDRMQEEKEEMVPGEWLRLMDGSPHAMYCTNRRWELRHINEACIRMFPGRRVPRNTTEWTLLDPDARGTQDVQGVLGDWEASWAREVLPLVRTQRALHRDDVVLAELEFKILADPICGPIYASPGPVYVDPDAAVRPFHHPELGPGWVSMLSAVPKSAPSCQIMTVHFHPGERPPRREGVPAFPSGG